MTFIKDKIVIFVSFPPTISPDWTGRYIYG